MANGYAGRILHVDLTDGKLRVEEPEESFYRKYMGGSAMGMHYVLKHCPPGADPLGPENVLALFNGVLSGTAISGQSRLTSVARSPLTNAIGDAQSGGYFPAELKFAGFDGIVIQGRSPKPVYLWVHHGEAELRDAGHLWGKVTAEVESSLKEELEDKRIEVLQIGPAGEKLVRYAALISMSNRANGRTGMRGDGIEKPEGGCRAWKAETGNCRRGSVQGPAEMGTGPFPGIGHRGHGEIRDPGRNRPAASQRRAANLQLQQRCFR